MSDPDRLAEQFETHRNHLRAVAVRMLGSRHEADDAVQGAWLRLSRSDTEAVDNLGDWLTTVVARVCFDMLRFRARKPESPPDAAPKRSPPHPLKRRPCSPTRSGWRSWSCWTPWSRRSGWPLCCTTCSPSPSRRSPRSWGGRRSPPGNWPVRRGGECRRTRLCRTPPLPARHRARADAPAGGAEAPRGTGVQHARHDEIGALEPPRTTDRQGAHRQPAPVAPGAGRAERREADREQRSGDRTAERARRASGRTARR